jgi:hypothetical protein
MPQVDNLRVTLAKRDPGFESGFLQPRVSNELFWRLFAPALRESY